MGRDEESLLFAAEEREGQKVTAAVVRAIRGVAVDLPGYVLATKKTVPISP
jgi:hypothetical protein